MKKRSKVRPTPSKKLFTKTAEKVHIKNAPPSMNMRGGIRT